jgi:phage terminase small subunit
MLLSYTVRQGRRKNSHFRILIARNLLKVSEEKMKKASEIIPVPEGLSEKSKTLWQNIVGKRASSPERLALLEVALRALDRADQAERQIEQEGLTCITPRSGISHANPLLKVERESRALFAKIWVQLGLRFDPVKTMKLEDFKFD